MKLQEVFAKKTYRHRLKTVTGPMPPRKVSIVRYGDTHVTDTGALEDHLANLIIDQGRRPPDIACWYISQALFRDDRADVDGNVHQRDRHRWGKDERREHFEGWFANLLNKRFDNSLRHYDAATNEDLTLTVTVH